MFGGVRVFGLVAAAMALVFALAGAPARAAAADPAVAQIESFNAALMDTMKQGKALGPQGRFRKLEPTVARTFDLATMTRFAVGPSWTSMSAADQQSLVSAFGRLTTAGYASNFKSYSGETFDVTPTPLTRGVDKVVQTKLTPSGGDPVSISYRMRQSGGTWKVIDVLLQGTISQLTIRRSDLASVVAGGDAKTIAATINAQADKLLAR